MISMAEKDFKLLESMSDADGSRTKSSLIAKWIREAAKNGGH